MTSVKQDTVSASALALVPVVVVLIGIVLVSSLAELGVSAMPFRFGEPQWRFNTFGFLLAQAPQLGLLVSLMLLAGVLGAYRTAIRGAAVLGLVLGVLFVILVPFFALDFLQQRRLVPLANRQRFDLAAMKTAAVALVFAPFLFWMGWRSWQASRVSKLTGHHRRTKGEGLIVGQETDN